jgi:uncharacterized repeat protein (TIGR01451 family)
VRPLGAIVALLLFGLPSTPSSAGGDPADLRLTKSDDADPVRAGTVLGYTLRVTNGGPDAAAQVVLSDTLPAGVIFHAADPSRGYCSGGPQLTCQLGNLAADDTVVVAIAVVPTTQGSATNTATVSSSTTDPNPGNNSATVTTTVAGPSCTRVGTRGDDRLEGTPGADVLCGAGGDDVLIPGPGSNDLLGGPGTDAVSYEGSSGGVRVDLGSGQATGQDPDTLVSIEDAIGSGKTDVLLGSAAPNRLVGGGATDILRGRDGPDRLVGGGGGDFLDGGAGDDVLGGGTGTDACESGRRRSCFPSSPSDGNDARGVLDVRRVRTGGGAGGAVWTVVTRAAWRVDRLWDDGFVLVFLDTAGSADPEFYALARAVGTGMRGELFRQREGIDQRIAGIRVRHSSPTTVRIRVPLRSLDVPVGRPFYRWSVLTILASGPCPRVCFDRVPGSGMLPVPLV